jgi:hypothetical protein
MANKWEVVIRRYHLCASLIRQRECHTDFEGGPLTISGLRVLFARRPHCY